MKTRFGAALLAILGAVFLARGIEAAEKVTIKLKDDTVIEGPLVRETEKAIFVKFAGIDDFEVDKADIAEIKREGGPKPKAEDPGVAKPATGGTGPAAGGTPAEPAEKENGEPDGEDPESEKWNLTEDEKAAIDKHVKDLGIAHAGNAEAGPWKNARTQLRRLKSKDATLYMLHKFRKAQGLAKIHLAAILAERGVSAIVPDIDGAITEAGVNRAPPRLIDYLGMIHTTESAKVLLKHLPAARQPILSKVLNALGANGDPRLAPATMRYLEHPDKAARASARVAVIKFGMALEKMAEPPFDLTGMLLKKVDKSKFPGEYAIVFAYVGRRDPRLEAPILGMLDSKDQDVLGLAVFAAGERQISAAKSRLLRIARSDQTFWRVRIDAVVALQKIRDVQVVPDLIDVVEKSENREVTRQIYKTLKGLTGQGRLPNSPAAWRKWWNEEGSKL